MRNFFAYLGLCLTVVSCIYPFNPELPDQVNRAVVIEGNILIGEMSTATLRYLLPLSGKQNGYPMGTAYVEDDQGKVYNGFTGSSLYENQGYQLYFDTREASSGCEYRLVVQVDGLIDFSVDAGEELSDFQEIGRAHV